MKNLFKYFLCGLMLSAQVQAASIQPGSAINTLTLNGSSVSYPSIVLTCYASTNTACTPRKLNASSGYQVTSGKTFYVVGIRSLSQLSSTSACPMTIAQAEADVGLDSASSATNPVWIAGSSSVRVVVAPGLGGQSDFFINGNFTIASQKYIYAQGGTGPCFYFVWGYEK